jgi:hypothetical protein
LFGPHSQQLSGFKQKGSSGRKEEKIVLKNGTAEELTFAFGSVILSLENIR